VAVVGVPSAEGVNPPYAVVVLHPGTRVEAELITWDPGPSGALQVPVTSLASATYTPRTGMLTPFRLVAWCWQPRGFSSVGRALAWHARGQGFESPKLHVFPAQKHVVILKNDL
jgi:hypothetical protein